MSAVDGSLATTLDGAASILDQLGAAGAILQPKMFDVWKDEVMHRRAMLTLMGLPPAAAALSPEQEKQRRTRSGAPTPETMRDLDQLADRYQALYHATAPAVLMTPVLAHLDSLGDLLRQGPAVAARRPPPANRARVATLARRLAVFELRGPPGPRGYSKHAPPAARADGHQRPAP